MVEAFDAAGATETLQGYGILLVWITAGVLLEFIVLRQLRRFTVARGWFPGEVVLTALSGQLIFWCSFVGIVNTLAQLVPNVRLTDVLRSLLALLAPLAITVFIVRLLTNSARLYLVRREIGSVSLISNILRVLGGAIVLGTTFALIGVPIGPLLTVLAGSSIGLSLALREPLSNLFSGMTVLASNKIQPGDYVRLSSGQEGYVTDIRWADTCIRELSNNLVVVPNSLMTSTIITNFYRPEPELSVLFDMGVPYDSNLARVEQLVVAVGEETHTEVPGGVPAFTPLVRFNAFGETSVRFTVILRARTFVDQFLLRHEFIKRLGERFAAEGLPPPRPIQILRLDPAGEEATIRAMADEDAGREP